jgi:hypothetical protein
MNHEHAVACSSFSNKDPVLVNIFWFSIRLPFFAICSVLDGRIVLYFFLIYPHCITHHSTFTRIMTYGISVTHINVHCTFMCWDSPTNRVPTRISELCLTNRVPTRI